MQTMQFFFLLILHASNGRQGQLRITVLNILFELQVQVSPCSIKCSNFGEVQWRHNILISMVGGSLKIIFEVKPWK